MRIDNDTASNLGSQLTHSHTHHITKCLYEEEGIKKSGAGAGIGRDTYQAAKVVPEENLGGAGFASPADKKFKSGKSFFRGMWEAMGDNHEDGEERILSAHDRNGAVWGVRDTITSVRLNISSYMVNKWEAAREKIKVGTDFARKYFGRNKKGFTMSSDMGQQTAGEGRKKWEKDEKQKGTRGAGEEIPLAQQADNHLMDSYSKTGEYCKINENLTYWKK